MPWNLQGMIRTQHSRAIIIRAKRHFKRPLRNYMFNMYSVIQARVLDVMNMFGISIKMGISAINVV